MTRDWMAVGASVIRLKKVRGLELLSERRRRWFFKRAVRLSLELNSSERIYSKIVG